MYNNFIKSWTTTNKQEVYNNQEGVKVCRQQVINDHGQPASDCYQVEMPSFTSILATTSNDEAVIIRQYKQGVQDICLTLPGGKFEDGDQPLKVARRDLLRDTGFGGGTWSDLGSFILSGDEYAAKAHLYLAENVSRMSTPELTQQQTMNVGIVPIRTLETVMSDGRFPILAHNTTIAMGMARLISNRRQSAAANGATPIQFSRFR